MSNAVRDCVSLFLSDLQRLIDEAIREEVAEELDRLSAAAVTAGQARSGRFEDDERPIPGRGRRGRRDAISKATGRSRSTRQTDEAQEEAASKSPSAPPLFVHRRARDGKIHNLSRPESEGESPEQPGAVH
ncbi:MAG TPA: hypothetical protein VGJ84_05290 [Polyangiaceae bacterium]